MIGLLISLAFRLGWLLYKLLKAVVKLMVALVIMVIGLILLACRQSDAGHSWLKEAGKLVR